MESAALPGSPARTILLDVDGVILGASPGAEALLACQAGALIGRSHDHLLLEADRERERELRGRCLAGERPGPREAARVRRDGAPVRVHVALAPVYDPDGAIVGFVESLRPVDPDAPGPPRRGPPPDDVVARRRIDAFEHCALGLALGDPRTLRILDANPAFARMLGSSIDELIGTPIAELYTDSTRPTFEHYSSTLAHASATLYRAQMRRRDGSLFPAEVAISVVHDAEGRPLHRVATLQDITAHELARQSLRTTKDWLDAVVKATPLPLVAVDPARLVILWNPAAEALFGWTADEVLGRPLPVIPPERFGEVQEHVDRVLAGDTGGGLLTQRVTRDGRRLDVRISHAPLSDERGKVWGMVAAYVDLTDHLALEAQFRRTAKMDSLGQLAGGVAHDFNNWLTVIGSCAELLELEHTGDPGSLELLREIQSASERAASLTRQLLSFSRRDVFEPRLLDLNIVVTETERMLRRLLGEDIDLSVDLAADLPQVKIDAGQWAQILMNLALNARDAMPQGGRLHVETRAIQRDDREFVRLCVTDNGVGMGPAIVARVFEPFFTTKEPGKGTGLGLAVVHGIVKQSGGYIEVDSAPRRGTTFRIDLPCATRPDAPPRASAQFRELCGGETILFVEDEGSLLRIAARALRGHGYVVIEAANGEEALRALAAHGGPFHLLLTDVVMPRMGGAALARALAPTYPMVPIIFTSGHTDEVLVRHDVPSGEVWFLAKPYTIHGLLQRVRQVLGGVAPG